MTYNSTIKRKKKICKGCGEECFIWSKGNCKKCDYLAKKDKPKKKEGFAVKESKRLIKQAKKIKQHSETNRYYSIALDEWFTAKQIAAKITEAKRLKLEMFYADHGYYFCENCKVNNAFKFDCSHNISVNDCKNRAEIELSLAWSLDNITILCRECHQQHDKLF